MDGSTDCPVCRNVEGGHCKPTRDRRAAFGFECSICGKFEATSEAYNWLKATRDDQGEPRELREITKMERALISHKLRSAERQDRPFVIDDGWIEHLISEVSLPSPIVQAAHMIRFIGDEVRWSGEDLKGLPDHLHAVIGAPGRQSAIDLAIELHNGRLLRLNPSGAAGTIGDSARPISMPTDITLTLDGWQRYEDERRGRFEGRYGFVAMQFGDPELESFVKQVLKPATKEMGYDLVDMRDVARAGVIDNIMRTQIRDSAFVIADLTHDNSGAYWEAGYAEGLGKPVIYICESAKFDEDSTHFDTNHCTTVPWSDDDPERFRRKLIATLRRSLDQE